MSVPAGPTRAHLADLRARTVERLRAAAVDNGITTSELKDLADRLKHIDLALAEFHAALLWKALLICAVIFGVAVTLLHLVLVGTTEFDTDATASAVQLHYSRADELSELSLDGPITVSGISQVEVSGIVQAGTDSNIDTVRIDAPVIRIQQARILAGSVLGLELTPGAFEATLASPAPGTDLLIMTAGAGELKMSSATRPKEAKILTLSDAELVRVSRAYGGKLLAPPVRIVARGVGVAQPIAPTGVDRLEFTRPAPARRTVAQVESSVIKASVQVGPKAHETRLPPGDALVLSGLHITDLHVGSCDSPALIPPDSNCKGLSIVAAGTADNIKVGRFGKLRSLKPSWLEFFKESYLVGLLWTAAAFLWGTGWSVWKAFGKQP